MESAWQRQSHTSDAPDMGVPSKYHACARAVVGLGGSSDPGLAQTCAPRLPIPRHMQGHPGRVKGMEELAHRKGNPRGAPKGAARQAPAVLPTKRARSQGGWTPAPCKNKRELVWKPVAGQTLVSFAMANQYAALKAAPAPPDSSQGTQAQQSNDLRGAGGVPSSADDEESVASPRSLCANEFVQAEPTRAPVFGPEEPTGEQWMEALAHRNAMFQEALVAPLASSLRRLRIHCRGCGKALVARVVTDDTLQCLQCANPHERASCCDVLGEGEQGTQARVQVRALRCMWDQQWWGVLADALRQDLDPMWHASLPT